MLPAVMDPAVVNRCSYSGTRHCSPCKDDKAAFTQLSACQKEKPELCSGATLSVLWCRQVDASCSLEELF